MRRTRSRAGSVWGIHRVARFVGAQAGGEPAPQTAASPDAAGSRGPGAEQEHEQGAEQARHDGKIPAGLRDALTGESVLRDQAAHAKVEGKRLTIGE